MASEQNRLVPPEEPCGCIFQLTGVYTCPRGECNIHFPLEVEIEPAQNEEEDDEQKIVMTPEEFMQLLSEPPEPEPQSPLPELEDDTLSLNDLTSAPPPTGMTPLHFPFFASRQSGRT